MPEEVEILRLAGQQIKAILTGCLPISDQHVRRLFKQRDRAGRRLFREVDLRSAHQEFAQCHRLRGQLQVQNEAATDEGRGQGSLLVRGDHDQGKGVLSLDRLLSPERGELPSTQRLEQSIRDVGLRLVDLVDQHRRGHCEGPFPRTAREPPIGSDWPDRRLRSSRQSPPQGSGTDELLNGEPVLQMHRLFLTLLGVVLVRSAPRECSSDLRLGESGHGIELPEQVVRLGAKSTTLETRGRSSDHGRGRRESRAPPTPGSPLRTEQGSAVRRRAPWIASQLFLPQFGADRSAGPSRAAS